MGNLCPCLKETSQSTSETDPLLSANSIYTTSDDDNIPYNDQNNYNSSNDNTSLSPVPQQQQSPSVPSSNISTNSQSSQSLHLAHIEKQRRRQLELDLIVQISTVSMIPLHSNGLQGNSRNGGGGRGEGWANRYKRNSISSTASMLPSNPLTQSPTPLANEELKTTLSSSLTTETTSYALLANRIVNNYIQGGGFEVDVLRVLDNGSSSNGDFGDDGFGSNGSNSNSYGGDMNQHVDTNSGSSPNKENSNSSSSVKTITINKDIRRLTIGEFKRGENMELGGGGGLVDHL